MVNSLKDLPKDIYKVLEGRTVFDDTVIHEFGDTIKDVLFKRLKQSDREAVLRMSNIGRPLRQLYYELNNYPSEKIAGKTLLKFLYGDLIEATVIALAQVAGYEVSGLQEKVEVDGVPGHLDVKINGILCDVKSASPYGFMKFKEGTIFDEGQDVFGYIGQLSGYAHEVKLPAAWIAINKVDGEVCVLDLPQDRIDSYDVKSRIKLCRETVKLPEAPERCYPSEDDGKSGNKKLGIGCSWCGWKYECWKDANNGEGIKTYIYSTGPRYLVEVKKEPQVFQANKKDNNING